MSMEQFEDLVISLTCKNVNMEFTADNFIEEKDEKSDEMFQFCAMNLPDLSTEQSLKY